MKKAGIYIFLAFAIAFSGEFRWSAKNTGMGDGGFSLALDAGGIFYNPALAGAFGGGVLSAGYGLRLTGIESSAESGYIAYARPLGWSAGAGLLWNFEKISTYQMLRLGGAFAYRIELAGTLTVGAGVNWLQRHYDLPPDDPLASRGNPSAVSFDAGILWQFGDKFAVGVSACDINEPDLALGDQSSEATKLPRRIGAGVSYRLNQYFIPEIGLVQRSFVVGEKSNPEYHFGFCGGLSSGTLFWRGGITPEAFNLGVGWRTSLLFTGMDIDYAFGLPLEKSLRSAGQTQHYFGITFYGKPTRTRRGDVCVKKIWIEGDRKVGRKITIKAAIRNAGKITLRSIPCALAIGDPEGKWRMIYPTKYIDSLAAKESEIVEWNWKPKKPGEYTIRVAADDDGGKIPDVSGTIPETDEDNNILTEKVVIAGADSIYVKPKFTTLTATHLIVKVEEEPVVPVVFFAPGSSELSDEAKGIISVIAGRMERNPDAKLVIYGYFDPSDGDADPKTLALARSDAIRGEILRKYPDLADRVLVSKGHDFKKPRLTSRYSKGDPRVAEENRRAEIKVFLREGMEHLSREQSIHALERNDEFLLVIVGHRRENEPENTGLARADSVRKEIIRQKPELARRIVAEEKVAADTGIEFVLDPDGIAVRPRERYPISEMWKNPQPSRNVILISRTGFENARRWEVKISSADGSLTHTIVSGEGAPPDSVLWDWSVGENQFLAPNTEYVLSVDIATDEREYHFASPEKIRVIPRKQMEAIENMLLVEFNFDETEPVSHYL
ncbi:MAG: hypothetical protein DRN14_07040, partial [Thermoplasmata archaeon]